MKILLVTLFLISTCGYTFNCNDPQVIHQKPIQFDKHRMALTQQYQLSHYGINSVKIEPKMIVLHWTCVPSLALTFRIFDKSILPGDRRDKLPGDLNVSSHYVVDQDGSIYQLMPDTLMARHVIGLNHYAIGIENIGGIDGKDDLTPAQVKANAYLVCYLKKKFPKIKHVIGHNEYLKYKHTPFWLEKNPDYQTDKTDPGPTFVSRVRKLTLPS